MTFSEWFIEMCAKHGDFPSNVAKAVGCTAPSGTGWANGAIPRKVTIKKIEDYFGEKYENKKTAPIIESGLNRKTIFAEMLYRLPDRDRLVIEHNIQMLYRLAQAEGKLKHNGLCVNIDLVMMELEKGRDRLLGGRED